MEGCGYAVDLRSAEEEVKLNLEKEVEAGLLESHKYIGLKFFIEDPKPIFDRDCSAFKTESCKPLHNYIFDALKEIFRGA